ncbi:MAG TPA: hypothetical protein VHW04_19630 [Solirubrobacteraceae bacterium]|nr:hypothetical protein [Solirubrobacteraceae bacterium]
MRTLVRAVVAIVIVAVVGFVLARSSRGTDGGSGGSTPALSGKASTTSFHVSYPANWHRLSAPATGLLPSLRDPLALAPTGTGEELVIGIASAGGSPAGELPGALRAALSTDPPPQIVSLGGRRFYRYLNLNPKSQGVTESVYLLGTTAGTIGAVCAAQKPSEAFTATCERVLGTLQLTRGNVLAPEVDPGYAFQLNTSLAKLNAARRALGPKLSAGSLPARARAAQQLAAAHAQAAASATRLSPHASGLAAANRALVSALEQTGSGYRALGGAITGRRQTAYNSAEGQIAAGTRALGAAFARLRGLGYRIG